MWITLQNIKSVDNVDKKTSLSTHECVLKTLHQQDFKAFFNISTRPTTTTTMFFNIIEIVLNSCAECRKNSEKV